MSRTEEIMVHARAVLDRAVPLPERLAAQVRLGEALKCLNGVDWMRLDEISRHTIKRASELRIAPRLH